jgi:hypothetical protein
VGQSKRPASRGVARRNAKLKALRELVGKDQTIVAVDLDSQRQAAVVCDHDSVVLARRMFKGGVGPGGCECMAIAPVSAGQSSNAAQPVPASVSGRAGRTDG